MNEIFVIIVIYNKNCADLLAMKKLQQYKNLHIIICDNSDRNFFNRETVERMHYTYLDMGGNKGLSKAYNRAISTIKGSLGYVCILDDDTDIDSYFEKINKHIEKGSADIYIPIVRDQAGILSPCISNGKKFKRFGELEDVTSRGISAINSGMLINLRVFNEIQYDQRLFLDFIDHQFIKDVKKCNFNIFVMKDILLKQNFSILDNTLQQDKIRESIIEKDLKVYYEKEKVYYYFTVMKRRIFLFWKHKSTWFIFNNFK